MVGLIIAIVLVGIISLGAIGMSAYTLHKVSKLNGTVNYMDRDIDELIKVAMQHKEVLQKINDHLKSEPERQLMYYTTTIGEA